MVCGVADTMRLPPDRLNPWENVQAPDSCGSTTNSAATIAKWMNDSIAAGGVYVATVTHYHCYAQADGCSGEGLGAGNQEAAAAMIAGCIPHHQ